MCSLFSGFLKGFRLGSVTVRARAFALPSSLNQSLACAEASSRSDIQFVLVGVLLGPVKSSAFTVHILECPGLWRAVIKARAIVKLKSSTRALPVPQPTVVPSLR